MSILDVCELGRTGQEIESYSAIIDKKNPVPQELVDRHTEYAISFFE